ncbi:MAG: hypothetical protein A3F91_02330 [Flavobacteria bacterium RIFCSPLOWO2_12_FULL_35_11]|nr:MAG: hypothetical protein A3F91_02330 [Flavobacteria bacterium RIFCSPLOWO2_12_FULL_35_11]
MKTTINRNIGIILIVFLALIACENNKEQITTGLEGIVYRGPINPVEMEGQVNDAPFSALFRVYNLKNKLITSFSSNATGEFMVMLAPGNYKIIPDKSAPIMSAESQVKEITVNPIGITNMDLYFDTGIR